MKLAEALMQRADMQKKLARLKERITQNALVQEGDTSAEDVNELIRDFEFVTQSLSSVVKAINKTNITTILSDGKTIADKIVDRDILGRQYNMFSELASSATVSRDRWSRNEVKFVSSVDVSGLRKKADSIAQKYRELDTAIQGKNWTTDLIE
jgi:hypothetical protein